eukprot:scaffold2053_cov106-Skeletonema_dohrnii-CCMP3373.AAC.3
MKLVGCGARSGEVEKEPTSTHMTSSGRVKWTGSIGNFPFMLKQKMAPTPEMSTQPQRGA